MKAERFSKIAVITYKQGYEENVDMLNPFFKQKELQELIKNDKDIIKVQYLINDKSVGDKMYTANQAVAQILKMNTTLASLLRKQEKIYIYGDKWYIEKRKSDNIDRDRTLLEDKCSFYAQFIDKKTFENSEIPFTLCCEWEDFKQRFQTDMEKELYNIFYNGIKLNTATPSMTLEKAEIYIGLCIINYGYRPIMIKAN